MILVIPAGVTQTVNGMPGKPPVEHDAVHAGEKGLVGDQAGAVAHLEPAELTGKVAGQEQVVSVIDVQGVGRISRARVDQLVALRIPGSTILQVVLVVAALLIFVVSGYFLGHFDHSF